MSDRLVPALVWSTATLMVAASVHLASILILPSVAPDNAFSRLVKTTTLNALSFLPKPHVGQDPIPFRDPAMATAVCRYDLRAGGLRIGAAVGDAAFMAVSFHDPKGVAYYALTNRSDNEGRIDLILLTPEQLERVEAADSEDDPVHEVRVIAPDDQGFVEFDVLPRVGGYATAREALSSASCQLEGHP